MTVLTRHLMGGGCPEVNISDLVYTYYRTLKIKFLLSTWRRAATASLDSTWENWYLAR